MPRRDRTGPHGYGAGTGRGSGGCCTGANALSYRRNSGYRRNICCAPREDFLPQTQKEFLKQEKDFLKNRLEIVSKELDNISNEDNQNT